MPSSRTQGAVAPLSRGQLLRGDIAEPYIKALRGGVVDLPTLVEEIRTAESRRAGPT